MNIVKKRLHKRFGVVVCLVSLLSFTLILYIGAPRTYAGTFSPRKVTITDSRASGTSVGYNFAFTTTVTTSIKQINIKFCNEAGLYTDTCTAPTTFSVSSATRASDNIAGTGRTDTQPAANIWQTVITTPASQATQAVTFNLSGVANPSTANTTYFARVITYSDTGTTTIDQGTTAFAMLTSTSMAVSATVLENFTFSIAGVASSGTVNGATTNITTAAATIPFGTMSVGTAYIGAHDVTVSTNAGSGYTVTVNTPTTNFLTSGSNNFSPFTGTYATPTTWSAPAGSTANTNTGFFGYTTEDTNYSVFQANKWAGNETTARAIITSATGVSSQTKRIGWQAQVNSIQPAGSYTGTVILVATPTY